MLSIASLIAAIVVTSFGSGNATPPAAIPSTTPQSPPPFSSPIHPPTVSRSFEQPVDDYSAGHRGADFAAASEQEVFAAGEGTVIYAGFLVNRGVISIEHAGDMRTTYEPVTPSVAAGERVQRGQRIGTVQKGHPGCPHAACLHWGAKQGTHYLDPIRLLRPYAAIRLKPWESGKNDKTTD